MKRNLNKLKREIMSLFTDDTWFREDEIRSRVRADPDDFSDAILDLMGSGHIRKRGLYPLCEFRRD